jgi:hypothetical protein
MPYDLKTTLDNLGVFNNIENALYIMADHFIIQDVYFKRKKNLVKSDVKPLTCHVCKKELNGISIAAKMFDGKTVFLCAHHYGAKPYQISLN